MHHRILIKVSGDTKNEAIAYANDIIEGTIRCPHCEASREDINWVYYKFIGEVTPEWMEEHRPDWEDDGVNSVEDLPAYYRSMLDDSEARLLKQVKKEHGELFDKNGDISGSYYMIGHYLEKLDRVRAIKKYGEDDEHLYTLHCTDNHFCDLTEDDCAEGDKVFWFWYDRHY